MDLMFLKNADLNLGYHILFNIIEINTKYVQCFALKNKQTQTIIDILYSFVDEAKNFDSVSFDSGSEFNNQYVKEFLEDYGTKIYIFNKSTEDYSHNQLMIIERFNRTLRDKITKYLIANKTKKWVTALPAIVNSYLTTVHSATGLTPEEARRKGFFNQKALEEKDLMLDKVGVKF